MLLISIEQMLSSASTSMIALKCDGCQQDFQRIQKQLKSDYKLKSQIQHFCSNKCQASLIKKELVKLTCANCNIDFSTTQGDFNKGHDRGLIRRWGDYFGLNIPPLARDPYA